MLQNYHMDLFYETWHPRTPAPQEKRLPLYLLDWGHFRAGERYFTRREDGRFYLLMYTVSGSGFLEYMGRRYELGEGQAALIDCGPCQRYGSCSEEWDFLWIHFDGQCAREYYERITSQGGPVLYPGQSPLLPSLLQEMEPFSRVQDTRSGLELSLRLVRILTQLAVDRLEETQLPTPRTMDDILDYMRNDTGESLSLDELAARAYLSKYHFLRVFKACTGMTPHAYMIHMKISRAKKLLKTTELTIGEVARHTGFHDAKAFASAFKKATGTTASQYRKQ